MTTSVRPRRAAALAVLAAAGSTLLVAPTAVAAPGDNGDIKVHSVGTASDDPVNEPKVCNFYLAAFNFDPGQTVTWTVETQPKVPGGPSESGVLALPTGAGKTKNMKLPDGTYKVTWKIVGGLGDDKHKVFKVDCPDDPASPPNGGPPAGGGGLARDDAFTPVAGAAGVGLAAIGGVAWLRFRRRADGTAS
ncbi:hypothetical protein [Streptomyces sp. DH24]|uniref:hypothetical protein n=1 Tax=Streptomyces sp. DH24 TaxID=3040123 RepID=UPI0024428FC5|nr:hypothetical protein [Streptomyces sp. DH24]MDG9718107.1 hypothetical protein [Streptomyces sp. DH24]